MQAFRTIIWIIIAIMLTVFAVLNSQSVEVVLMPGNPNTIAEMPLALLILIVFLMGFMPPFLFNMGNRWRLGRQIAVQEQVIAQLKTPAATPAALAPDVEGAPLS